MDILKHDDNIFYAKPSRTLDVILLFYHHKLLILIFIFKAVFFLLFLLLLTYELSNRTIIFFFHLIFSRHQLNLSMKELLAYFFIFSIWTQIQRLVRLIGKFFFSQFRFHFIASSTICKWAYRNCARRSSSDILYLAIGIYVQCTLFSTRIRLRFVPKTV